MLLLEENQVFATEMEVEALISRYDQDKDTRISFSDFV